MTVRLAEGRARRGNEAIENHRTSRLPQPRTLHLGQPRGERTGGHYPPPFLARPPPPRDGVRGAEGGRRCVTPRQTCPRPNGFGRNLRSKTRWFTGFCNSHQVSHFATFFIDARAEISVAESRYDLRVSRTRPSPRRVAVSGAWGRAAFFPYRSLARTAPGFVWAPEAIGVEPHDPDGQRVRGPQAPSPPG